MSLGNSVTRKPCGFYQRRKRAINFGIVRQGNHLILSLSDEIACRHDPFQGMPFRCVSLEHGSVARRLVVQAAIAPQVAGCSFGRGLQHFPWLAELERYAILAVGGRRGRFGGAHVHSASGPVESGYWAVNVDSGERVREWGPQYKSSSGKG